MGSTQTISLLNLDKPWYDRLDLVNQINDSKTLFKAIKITPEVEVRSAIVNQSNNIELLKYVCQNDEDPALRYQATIKLPDSMKETLSDLVLNDTHHTVRKAAVIKLSEDHQNVFLDVITKDNHVDVRKKAVKKMRLDLLTDQQLHDLCIYGQEPLVRKGAVYQLENEELLAAVAISTHDYRIIELAIAKVETVSLLEKIAKTAEFAHGRYSAIYKLSDQEFILNVCLNDNNIEVKKSCIEKIHRRELLARLRVEGSEDIQYLVKQKLTKLS